MPDIGRNNGRPKRPMAEWEIKTVKEAFDKFSVLASTLMKLIERDCGKHINHNRIHRILLSLGMSKSKGKKDWIRYERRYRLTAVHIDWYYDALTEIWVFAVIDDASRKLLAIAECKNPTTESSIEGMKAIGIYLSVNPVGVCKTVRYYFFWRPYSRCSNNLTCSSSAINVRIGITLGLM